MAETTPHKFGLVDLGLLAMVAIWGANFSIVKIGLESLSPLVFNAIRYTAATAIVLLATRIAGEDWHVDRHDARQLIILGLVGNTVYQLLFISGIAHTTAGNSALMLGGTPVYVSLIGVVTGVERLHWRGWLGCLMAFGGILLIVVGSDQAVEVRGESLLGSLLVLCGAVAWAVYTVLSRPLLRRHSSLKVTGLSMLAGMPALLLAGVPGCRTQNWVAVPWQGWLGLAYSAALALGVAYVAWNAGVKVVGSARTAIYSNLTPVIAMIIGWLWLGERLGWLKIAGAAVIVGGVFLTRLDVTPAARNSAQERYTERSQQTKKRKRRN
jgi:drug/metabolite transporter (DMT)-like permease